MGVALAELVDESAGVELPVAVAIIAVAVVVAVGILVVTIVPGLFPNGSARLRGTDVGFANRHPLGEIAGAKVLREVPTVLSIPAADLEELACRRTEDDLGPV